MVTFIVYSLSGNELTAAKCFTALTLFNILRIPLANFPQNLTRVITISVVMRRLSAYLAASESQTLKNDDVILKLPSTP